MPAAPTTAPPAPLPYVVTGDVAVTEMDDGGNPALGTGRLVYWYRGVQLPSNIKPLSIAHLLWADLIAQLPSGPTYTIFTA